MELSKQEAHLLHEAINCYLEKAILLADKGRQLPEFQLLIPLTEKLIVELRSMKAKVALELKNKSQ